VFCNSGSHEKCAVVLSGIRRVSRRMKSKDLRWFSTNLGYITLRVNNRETGPGAFDSLRSGLTEDPFQMAAPLH